MKKCIYCLVAVTLILSIVQTKSQAQTDKAKIYVINPKTKAYVYEVYYYLDGKFIGGVFKKGNSYMELNVEPGEHYITAQIISRNQLSKVAIFRSYNSVKIDAEAGKEYFVKQGLACPISNLRK